MTVHDAEPSDIYVDPQGKLWRCVSTCQQPTVIFEEVEGHVPCDPRLTAAAQAMQQYSPPSPQLIRERKSGGVSGLLFDGWKRIFRPEPKSS